MLLSSNPLNVLTDLIRSGRIEIEYTHGNGNTAAFAFDRATAKNGLLPQMLKVMSEGGQQRMGIKITPRRAKGKPFTTGNEILDGVAADTLKFIEGYCEYTPESVKVEVDRHEHKLTISCIYLHLVVVKDGQERGEFAKATNLAISTKGTVTFGSIATSSV